MAKFRYRLQLWSHIIQRSHTLRAYATKTSQPGRWTMAGSSQLTTPVGMPNANKLSQVSGNVAAATMRDEVALAVANYFSLFYSMYEQTQRLAQRRS